MTCTDCGATASLPDSEAALPAGWKLMPYIDQDDGATIYELLCPECWPRVAAWMENMKEPY